MLVDYLTLGFALVAAVGSLWRIYQNERLYRWHRKIHKKSKRKKK